MLDTKNTFHNLGSPGTYQSTKTKYLSLMCRETDIMKKTFARQTFYLKYAFSDCNFSLRIKIINFTTDHH